MKKRYFGWEQVFEFIWKHADRDGLWDGNDATLATEFRVKQEEAHATLVDLCNRGLIEELLPGKFAIARWRERDDEEEKHC